MWRSRLEDADRGVAQTTLVAEREGRWIGLASARLGVEEPGQVSVFGVWVDPSARRRGIAAALMAALAEWARVRGADQLSLWVIASNGPAVALYRRIGFATTGRTQPVPREPRLVELHMVRAVSATPERASAAGDSAS